LGEQEVATKELQAYGNTLKTGKSGDWPMKISHFLTGQLAETDFFKAADNAGKKKDREQHCEAYFYAGSKRLIEGDKITATNYFEKCLATEVKNFNEYQSAAAELNLHLVKLQVVSYARPDNPAARLLDCSRAFHHRHQRWPKDYAELSEFVQKSDGKLKLGHYDQVEFKNMPNDALEIWQVSGGTTTFGTLTASPTKK